jgi:hypothetical protein
MSANCTIVTCYYRSPAKHSLQNYDQWMKNFLMTIHNPMIIFCDEASASTIETYREKDMNKTKIIVLPLYETYCGDPSKHDLWIHDWHRDIEQRIHHPNLYIIWNEKAKFVERAMELNPFDTDFFCWCDIGCFRRQEELYLFEKEWPSSAFLQSAKKDKMYFLNITPFEENDFNILPNGLTHSFERVTRIGATMFLGHKTIFQDYIQLFYETMEQYIKNDYFTGKDQNIIATLYVLKPELFKLIRPIDGEGDPWFYLQRYFLKETSI